MRARAAGAEDNVPVALDRALLGGLSTSPLAVTMKRRALGAAVAALVAAGLVTAAEPLATGEYGTEDGLGTLVISSGTAGQQSFRLSAEGANGHSCGFTGSLKDGEGRVNVGTRAELSICTVTLEKSGAALSVALSVKGEDAWEHCRSSMCGARAGFDGTYFLLPTPCTDAARQQTRESFVQAFHSGDYQQAAEIFEGLQAQCGRFLKWLERDQIRNNLAMALHRLGRDAECLQELSKTEAATVADESKLRDRFVGVPYDFERYLPIAQTTWKVQSACSGSK